MTGIIHIYFENLRSQENLLLSGYNSLIIIVFASPYTSVFAFPDVDFISTSVLVIQGLSSGGH
jgi:hypothetical protein